LEPLFILREFPVPKRDKIPKKNNKGYIEFSTAICKGPAQVDLMVYYLNFARNCRFQAAEIDFSRLLNPRFVSRHSL